MFGLRDGFAVRALTVVVSAPAVQHANQVAASKAGPSGEIAKYYWAFSVTGTDQEKPSEEEAERLQKGHISNLDRLGFEGKGLFAGLLGDNGRRRGVVALKLEPPKKQRPARARTPGLESAGCQRKSIPARTTEEGIRKPARPVKMKECYLGLLKKGPAWSGEKSAETEMIQAGRMANIRKVAASSEAALAGSRVGAGDLRGVFVFRINSEERIRTLVADDPAIESGHLQIELHPLYLLEGVLGP